MSNAAITQLDFAHFLSIFLHHVPLTTRGNKWSNRVSEEKLYMLAAVILYAVVYFRIFRETMLERWDFFA